MVGGGDLAAAGPGVTAQFSDLDTPPADCDELLDTVTLMCSCKHLLSFWPLLHDRTPGFHDALIAVYTFLFATVPRFHHYSIGERHPGARMQLPRGMIDPSRPVGKACLRDWPSSTRHWPNQASEPGFAWPYDFRVVSSHELEAPSIMC